MEIALGSLDIFSLGKSGDYNRLFLKIVDNKLIDRLYRRYVKREDVSNTRNMLNEILFQLESRKERKCLIQIIKAFDDQAACAEYSLQDYGKYHPIRIFLTASPYRYLQIPLEDYDNLEGDPLWMRPEYMLEKYYPKEKQEKDKKILAQMKQDHPDWF
jgi:hypothetical protein